MSQGNYKDHLFALIVVGGGGTRLWPKSRNATPKQFLKLFDNKTLTQITAHRFKKILPWERIFAVTTSNSYKKEILREVPEFLPKNIIVEPMRRNTAPAHGLGALFIYRQDKDAIILNESADHLVRPESKYFNAMYTAAEAAYSGDWLVAVGMKPAYPNIGYGYMKRGKQWKIIEGRPVYKLDKFTEKPKLSVAKKFLASGNYFWNGNQYVWRADTFLKALNKHTSVISKGLRLIGKAISTKMEESVIKTEYEKMPEISVDYAVSEKAKNFLLVTADYFWTDIGDWKEVWENRPKDSEGNVIIDGDMPGGEIINLDTQNAIVHTDGRLIALVDVDDIIVVDTKDALLVATKSKAQNVKKIVEWLKKEKKKRYL